MMNGNEFNQPEAAAPPPPDPLPSDEGHYPRVVLLDTGAVLSAWEDRCIAVPKGQARIAQRFNAGMEAQRSRVPKGRPSSNPPTASFSRPFGTCVPCGLFPGVKTPGYSRDVPPGQRNVAAAFSAKQATRFICDAFWRLSRPQCPARKLWGTIISEGKRDGVTGPLAGPGAEGAHRLRSIPCLRVRLSGKEARISRSFGTCTGIFSFIAMLMLLWALVGAGFANADERLSAPVALSAEGFADESFAHNSPQNSPQTTPRRDEGPRRVFKDRVAPHWCHASTRFWYRNDLRGGAKEFVVVDAERGTRAAAFDHEKLAMNLSKAAGAECKADRLPFDNIEFTDDSKAVRFNVGDSGWKCDLNSYECSRTDAKASAAPASETNAVADAETEGRRGRDQRPRETSDRSPDGKWIASAKDYNVFIRSRDDEKEIQLSDDGKEGLAYGRLS